MEIKYVIKEVPTQTLADIGEGVPFRVDRYHDVSPYKMSLFEKIASDIYEDGIFIKVVSPEGTGFASYYVVDLSKGVFYDYNQIQNFSSYNEIADENEYEEGTIFPADLSVIPVKAALTIEQ